MMTITTSCHREGADVTRSNCNGQPSIRPPPNGRQHRLGNHGAAFRRRAGDSDNYSAMFARAVEAR